MSLRFEDEGLLGDNSRTGDQSYDRCDSLPRPTMEYIERCSDRLDGQRFSAKRLRGDIREIRDFRHDSMHDTGEGARNKKLRC